jgi:hypothetical protein
MSRKLPARSEKATLSETVDRRVKLYSIAAAAAGVSMLALAQPAEGEVLITKQTIPIFGLVYLDINHDGVNDFEFYSYFSFGSADLAVRGILGGGGALVVGQSGYASPLMRGANIGPAAHFCPSSSLTAIEKGVAVGYPNEKLYGPWGGNPKNRYLGVRFKIDGQIHYGWVRLTMLTQPAGTWSATITAYAYETIPNKPIFPGITGKPAVKDEAEKSVQSLGNPSLGMLALGADGLALWRREETPAS